MLPPANNVWQLVIASPVRVVFCIFWMMYGARGWQAGRQAGLPPPLVKKQPWVVALLSLTSHANSARCVVVQWTVPQPSLSLSRSLRSDNNFFARTVSPVHVARVCTLRHFHSHWQLSQSPRATLAQARAHFFSGPFQFAIHLRPHSLCLACLFFILLFLLYFLPLSLSSLPLCLSAAFAYLLHFKCSQRCVRSSSSSSSSQWGKALGKKIKHFI